ncbi:MAG: glutamate 5-kinase [Rhodospirillaceae bacterium]|nr:glutamate 5-kinase [Rhodospirillaceae bacterium]|tara:strand:+ start:1180 stop:2322 length:1143 start_codon:yes stop_codon:yes gene_type:complete
METHLTSTKVVTPLADSTRIVIKIGSALLVDENTGELRRKWLAGLADDISALRAKGKQVLIVSSGAIALGSRHLEIQISSLKLEEKQAAAATGQIRLAHAYEDALARHNITVAQILLSPEDTEQRRRHLNARATIMTLLSLNVVPIINENDTVTTKEIRFGDNDRLGARVAQMVSADTLLLLSDVDGLYDRDPQTDEQAQHIPFVKEITSAIEDMAGVARTGYSSGGMVTKLAAARIATNAGCQMAIVAGKKLNPISSIYKGARCTWFEASSTPRGARKSWIASAINPCGAIYIDEGAITAIKNGRSLLPAGIVSILGDFDRGDLVTVHGEDKKEVARGLAAYSSHDTQMIKGHKSADIKNILGYRGRDELIHRDDLVLI